jgi:hypothetical protein
MKVEMAWVDVLLARWGRWSIRCESGALGFASSCVLGGGLGGGDGYDSSIPKGVQDDDLALVDASIRKLPKVLRLTVVEVYQFGQGKSDRALAAVLGVHVDTMRKYVCEAHRKIALDISEPCAQNPSPSANWQSCVEGKQPVSA